jgi:hypothetical protein
MIDLVLATDMKQHFALVGQFTGVQQATANQQAAQATPTQSLCQVLLPDDNRRILSLQIAIKAADLANLCDPHHTHIKWVHMLEEEVSGVGSRHSTCRAGEPQANTAAIVAWHKFPLAM